MSNLAEPENVLPRSILSEFAPLMERGAVAADVARTYDLSPVSNSYRAVLEESFVGKLAVTP